MEFAKENAIPARTGRAGRRRLRRLAACCPALLVLLVLTPVGVGPALAAPSSAPAAVSDVVVNVNTASPEELQALPGIGESRAQAIIELRKQRGGFKSLDELGEVKGIGEATLERLKPMMRLSGTQRVPRP